MPSRTPLQVSCSPTALEDVRRLPPLPSGYRTDRVLRLDRREQGPTIRWELTERKLDQPFVKKYDSGAVDEWLDSYVEAAPPYSFKFLQASVGDTVQGLLTWLPQEWNETIWLVDIRIREAARGQGIGSALLASLCDTTRARGARGISVETQSTNYPALSFYRKHGFRVAGFNDRLYTDDDLEDGEVALFLFWQRTR